MTTTTRSATPAAFAGTLVAEVVRSFTLVATLADALPSTVSPDAANLRFSGAEPGEPLTFTSTLTSRVYRAGDGTLTFAYSTPGPLDAPGFGGESTRLSATGFGGFDLSAGALVQLGGSGPIARSADGETVAARSGVAGLGATSAVLVIDTDATAFDAGGSADYLAGTEGELLFEVAALPPDSPDFDPSDVQTVGVIGFPRAAATIDGVFRPVPADAGGGDGPAVVPLPAGAWAGLAMLGGVGLAGAARRRRVTA